MQLMYACRNTQWWANRARHTHHCLSYIWVWWQIHFMMSLVGRKPFWPITAMHLLQGGLFFTKSLGRLVFVTALSPLIDCMKSETKLLFLSGDLVADALGFA